MKLSALIGHTGFIGGNLAAQHRFDKLYNSIHIDRIAGHSFDLLVVSAMPAAASVANNDPAGDRAVLEHVLFCLRKARAKRVVLISTVSVYPNPVGVHEASTIDPGGLSAFGTHRLILEQELAERFRNLLIVRLPDLFGRGLKINPIYEFLHGNEVHKLNCRSIYQFYNLDRLWFDIAVAASMGLKIINLVTEPVSLRELASAAFDLGFCNDPGTPPVRFDVCSRYGTLYGSANGYLSDRHQVLGEIASFVRQERVKRSVKRKAR